MIIWDGKNPREFSLFTTHGIQKNVLSLLRRCKNLHLFLRNRNIQVKNFSVYNSLFVIFCMSVVFQFNFCNMELAWVTMGQSCSEIIVMAIPRAKRIVDILHLLLLIAFTLLSKLSCVLIFRPLRINCNWKLYSVNIEISIFRLRFSGWEVEFRTRAMPKLHWCHTLHTL